MTRSTVNATLASELSVNTQSTNNKILRSYIEELKQQFTINNKLLLVQLPQLLINNICIQAVRNKAAYAYPPTGLQAIATALSGLGLDISILDLNFLLLKTIIKDHDFDPRDWLNLLDQKLEQYDPCFVGISCISVSSLAQDPDFHLTQILDHLSRKQKYILVAGGPNATDESKFYITNKLCHFVIKGEGENKVRYLFDYFYPSATPHPPTPLSGIAFQYNNCYQLSNGIEVKKLAFDNLIPSYAQIPLEDYNKIGSLNPFSRMSGQNKHFAPIQLHRGCRADCMFCGVSAFNGHGVRQNSISGLIQEIHYLAKERHVRHFELLDDDFFGGGKYKHAAILLLTELRSLHQQYGVTWSAGNGLIATSLFEPILELISHSGCIGFRIGIETANAKLLKRIKKPTSIAALHRLQEQIEHYPQLFIAANYIIGFFAEETFSSMMDTFLFALKSNFDWASYSTFQFTSQGNAKIKGFETDKKSATEFIPSKNTFSREIVNNQIHTGMDIFTLDASNIPSRSQINEIWYTFNFINNYAFNKNLCTNGNHKKLISWLSAIELAYPQNPIMPLFCSFYYSLDGNPLMAGKKHRDAVHNINRSRYWKRRIEQFHLADAVSTPKLTPNSVIDFIKLLQNNLMLRISKSCHTPIEYQ